MMTPSAPAKALRRSIVCTRVSFGATLPPRAHISRDACASVGLRSDTSATERVNEAVQTQTHGPVASESQRNFSRAFFFDALAVDAITSQTVDHVVRHAVTAGDSATAVGEAVRAGVKGVSTETLAHAHQRCVCECDSAAAEAVLRVAEAAGVPREDRRAWVAAAAVASHTDPRMVAARVDALNRCLAMRRGGLGTDAAVAMVHRFIDAGTVDRAHIELVARNACFTAAEVLDLVVRSGVAGVQPSAGAVARLAECVVVEAGTKRKNAHQFLSEAITATISSMSTGHHKGVVNLVHASDGMQDAMASLFALPADRLEKLRLDSLRQAFDRGARGYDAATALFDRWCSARGNITQGLARFAMMHQHFSERGHERVLRQVVAAGIEPDAGVYAALVTRHRLEGDEEAARGVIDSMMRAEVQTSGDALRAVLRAPDDKLMRQRLSLLSQKASQVCD